MIAVFLLLTGARRGLGLHGLDVNVLARLDGRGDAARVEVHQAVVAQDDVVARANRDAILAVAADDVLVAVATRYRVVAAERQNS